MKKLLAILALIPALAFAWQPSKPITVIFPNGPGAGNEISFRIVADIVERQTGAKFVPEYRPGADGNIAINHFVTVPTDGHTISVPACQSNWVTPEIWYPKVIKYNPMDLEPIASIARSPLAFWAHPSSKINTPEELVAAIRKKERPITIAIGGVTQLQATSTGVTVGGDFHVTGTQTESATVNLVVTDNTITQKLMVEFSWEDEIYAKIYMKRSDVPNAMQKAISCAKTGIELCAPYLHTTKKEICTIGNSLNVPLLETWSCYQGGITPCGKCDACIKRQEALV